MIKITNKLPTFTNQPTGEKSESAAPALPCPLQDIRI